VASAGDVNGDGRPDLLVGTPLYIVFAQADDRTVNLARLDSQGKGYRIDGVDSDFPSVASAGDVGLGGDDTLVSGKGDDILDGGVGDDTLLGGQETTAWRAAAAQTSCAAATAATFSSVAGGRTRS